MNSEKERLERLIELARRTPSVRTESADAVPAQPPLGFATRVAARWAASPRSSTIADAWERVSWWGSALAATACLLAFALQPPAPEPTGFDLLLGAQEEQTF